MNNSDRTFSVYERMSYLRSVKQEAAVRGQAWVNSVLRPCKVGAFEQMETHQLRAVFRAFFTGGTAKPGIWIV